MIVIKDVLKDSDQCYAEIKLGENLYKTPIPLRPVIQSEQVKALAEVLSNHVNNELSVLKARILELERQLDR
jgi:hypothetical protein